MLELVNKRVAFPNIEFGFSANGKTAFKHICKIIVRVDGETACGVEICSNFLLLFLFVCLISFRFSVFSKDLFKHEHYNYFCID